MDLPLSPSSPYTLLDSGILIVEPHTGLRGARTLLLTAAAQQIPGLASMRGGLYKHRVRLAILSHSLGVEVLRSVAHDIRVLWPHARILILGSVQLTLEDHLYDDAITDHPSSEELLIALMRLTTDTPSKEAALGLTVQVTQIGTQPHHRNPSESDPRKISEAAVTEQVALHTMPAAATRLRRAC